MSKITHMLSPTKGGHPIFRSTTANVGVFVFTLLNLIPSCWFESTSSDGYKWCREYGHLWRHYDESFFLQGTGKRESHSSFLSQDILDLFSAG